LKKKIVYTLLLAVSIIGLFLSGFINETTTNAASTGKVLVVYYSNSGTTQSAAKRIQKKTGGDLVKLRMSPRYPSDYDKLTKVSKKQIDKNIHPKILNKINMKKYQTILLGFPTWYHRPPMFINSFFEKYNLRGKTVVPFSTSMSSPMSVNRPYLRKMVKGKGVKLQKGFRVNSSKNTNRYLKKHDLNR